MQVPRFRGWDRTRRLSVIGECRKSHLRTGSPFGVILSAALAFAPAEILAGSTGDLLCARAHSRPSSLKSIGAKQQK